MNKQNRLPKIAGIIFIILLSLISFVGIYVKKLNKMENIVPDYQFSMDFADKRIAKLDVDTSSDTIYYDADHNVVEEEVEGGTTENNPVNANEVLTAENFQKVKNIITKRMKTLGAPEYYIRQDENGNLVIELPEDENADLFLYTASQTGEFRIEDADSGELLLGNEDIEKCDVVYSTTTATTIYLNIQFKKDACAKLAEVSKTYVETTDEEGNTNTKNVIISIDGTTLTNTYFGQTIENGLLSVPVGSTSTDTTTLNSNYEQAKIYETILNTGKLPVVYTTGEYGNMVENTYTNELAQVAVLIGLAILLILIVYMIARYHTAGIIAGILQIGFIAALLLIIRYTNCLMSVNGMVAIAILALFQFAFLHALLHDRKKYLKTTENDFKQTFAKYIKLSIPIDVIALLYTFVNWVPISSMGMILFWGIVLFAIYNIGITKIFAVENKK